MDLGFRADIEQNHGLHLTTELAQGLSVLGMDALDLYDYVRECIDENPFFDADAEGSLPEPPFDSYRCSVSSDALLERRGHGSPERFGNERQDMSQRDFSFDRFLTTSESLEDYLTRQIRIMYDDDRRRAIGAYTIGFIDRSGYLRTPVFCIASALGVEEREVGEVLEAIQRIEPVGIGARNLSECLRLQLEERNAMTPVISDILDEHLDEFATRTPSAIAKSLGVSLQELSEAMDVVRTCNPRPAAQFGGSSSPIWPEVVVDRVEGGGYEVRLQDFYLPALRIDGRYRTLVARGTSSGRTDRQPIDDYLHRKLKEAEGLLSSIRFRGSALYKVACCIVEMQTGFFDEGYAALKPLTMVQVANIVGVSESTVSRLVNGNYMQTPRGVYELRFFFHSAAHGAEGGIVSSRSVKHRIEEIVKQEDPAHPLSDQAIADALACENVIVSRRTVNKYRDEMGIPPRSARRRK